MLCGTLLLNFNNFSVMSTDYGQISFNVLGKVKKMWKNNNIIDFLMDFERFFPEIEYPYPYIYLNIIAKHFLINSMKERMLLSVQNTSNIN